MGGRHDKLVAFYGSEEALKAEMQRRRQVAIDMGKPAGGLYYASQETKDEVGRKARAGKRGTKEINISIKKIS